MKKILLLPIISMAFALQGMNMNNMDESIVMFAFAID
jgi:hypothetical protein